MSFAVRIRGMDQVRANLAVLRERVPQDLGRVMREEACAIMDASIPQCPIDDANLHEDGSPHLVDTAQVSGPYFSHGDIHVYLSYGNQDDPTDKYAVIQHENLEYHHTRPGTKAKYLEDPANERAPFIATNLIRGISLEVQDIGYFAPRNSELIENLAMQTRWNRLRQIQNKGGMLTGRFA